MIRSFSVVHFRLSAAQKMSHYLAGELAIATAAMVQQATMRDDSSVTKDISLLGLHEVWYDTVSLMSFLVPRFRDPSRDPQKQFSKLG
jgi:hypothetical protein